MFNQCDILDDRKSKVLREKSKEVSFPMDEKDILLMNDMVMYLRLSQDEEYASRNNIRAGMGLSAVQLGILKRFFVISYKKDDGTFDEFKVVNPKIVSNSEELVYVEEGEGCLSVNRYVEGIVPRYARVTMEGYDRDGNKIQVRAREELAICFQHELDHLNGIMFFDHINPKNPYYGKDQMRAI